MERRIAARVWMGLPLVASVQLACGEASSPVATGETGDATTATTTTLTGATDSATSDGPTTASTSSPSGTDADVTSADGTGEPKFDVHGTRSDVDDEPPPPSCYVVDDMDAVGECGRSAPPDSFDPEIQ